MYTYHPQEFCNLLKHVETNISRMMHHAQNKEIARVIHIFNSIWDEEKISSWMLSEEDKTFLDNLKGKFDHGVTQTNISKSWIPLDTALMDIDEMIFDLEHQRPQEHRPLFPDL